MGLFCMTPRHAAKNRDAARTDEKGKVAPASGGYETAGRDGRRKRTPEARAGDGRRADVLGVVDACYADVLAYCARRLPTREDAQDAAQETFLRYTRAVAAGTYRGHGSARAYVIGIARNVCVDAARRASARPVEPLETDVPAADDGSAAADFGLLIASLPPELQEVLELRFDQNLGVAEAARVLGISRFACARRIRRALRLLKESLEADDGKI